MAKYMTQKITIYGKAPYYTISTKSSELLPFIAAAVAVAAV